MKTTDTKRKKLAPAASTDQQPAKAKEKLSPQAADTVQPEIQFSGEADTPTEVLQRAVYNAGTRMLNVLRDTDHAGLLNEQSNTDLENARKALQEVGQFSFNIGFAGEQSSGKSTVINSLLRYPLMPTCITKTTAVIVKLVYSQHLRVQVTDEDTQKVVLDFDCHMPKDTSGQKVFRERFQKLLDYGIDAMHELTLETFQPFSDLYVLKVFPSIDDMDMTPENPRHVMALLFVLLAVYVGQNDSEWDEQKEKLMKKREKLFRSFGIPTDVVNLSIFAQANFDILKKGLVITDLPGLGSSAGSQVINGKKVMGHDEITINAIKETDAMIFLSTPENREAGYEALKEMISNARIKDAVYKSDRIIAVLNKADRCEGAQRSTVLRDFCKALSSVGVTKKEDDIICYSAIAGEFRFEDTPFERTLYFKKNYDEETIREDAEFEDKDFENKKQEVINQMKRRAEKKYEKSGIEELLNFFRSTYVDQGKYIKSTFALQAIRILVTSQVNDLRVTAENCELLSKNHAFLQRNMVVNIKTAIEKPIANAIDDCFKSKNQISKDIDDDLAIYTENVIPLYISAFEEGLSSYKKNLMECMSKFDTTWLGYGSKARVDKEGSYNQEVYSNLKTKMDMLCISLTEVNNHYTRMLTTINKRIDKFYTDVQVSLNRLQGGISDMLNAVINEVKEQKLPADEIKTLDQLKNQLITYVKNQLNIIQAKCLQQIKNKTDAQKKVVDAMLRLSRTMAKKFEDSVKSDLKNRTSKGGVFTAKEYILINGDGGLKSAIDSLRLETREKENIKMNLEAEVNSVVRNTIPNWLNDLNNIIDIFNALHLQLIKPTQNLISSLQQDAETTAKQAEDVRKKIEQWKALAQELNKGLLNADGNSILALSCAQVNDREPDNLKLQKDVFFDCFD